MPSKLGLSESEYAIMSIIWKNGDEKLQKKDIFKILSKNGYAWKPQTVQTFLDHLVYKKALSFHWQGHKKLYFPSSSKAEFAAHWIHKVIEENFDSMDEFVLSFNNLSGQLTEEQKKELKNIWNE